MNKSRIICADCKYARQDIKASEYTRKTCKKCDKWSDCEVCHKCGKLNTCKARERQDNKQTCERRYDNICGEQKLQWAALECGNTESEYYKSLLNVTRRGDMQDTITWGGCVCGRSK